MGSSHQTTYDCAFEVDFIKVSQKVQTTFPANRTNFEK